MWLLATRGSGNCEEKFTMQCTKCGAMLSPGTTTCPRCGTPVSARPPESAGSAYGLEEESIPYMDFGPFMESVSKPPTGQLQNPPPHYFFPRPQNPPTQPAYPLSRAQPAVQQQQPESAIVQLEPQRQGLSRG